jgi:type IV pilus assembly protein PilQ
VPHSLWQLRLMAAALLSGLPVCALPAPALAQVPLPVSPVDQPAPSASAVPFSAPARARGVELKVRRLPDAVEVVVAGTGPAPQLLQTNRGASWEGRVLTPAPLPLRMGPQRLSLPEAGLQSISLTGSGNTFSVVVSPVPGFPVGRPVVSADGRDLILSFPAPVQPTLQTSSPNLSAPGRVAQPGFVPPLQPRAVAPPVGDMAVGTMMLGNASFVNVSGPAVTMTLKNALVRDVLMAIARHGNYGFVYVDDSDPKFKDLIDRRISISFRNESYGRAVNSALLAAGLQGKLEGNMILAGPNVLAKSFGSTMSKVYRLNQASANAAADYLANLGASVTKTNTITTAVTSGANQQQAVQGAPSLATTTASRTTQVETYGSALGPLVGLLATTDTRLSSITLVGAPQVVAIAEQYLKQIDLRQRQVALSLKILDVDLTNDSTINNSFAFRWGNNFIVSDDGTLLGAFGRNQPPLNPDGFPRLTSTVLTNPGLEYPRDSFFDFVKAQIEARSTKVLASPTLILQENPSILRDDGAGGAGDAASSDASGSRSGLSASGIDSPIGRRRGNEGVVRVGVDVPTKVNVVQTATTGTTSCEIDELTTAGLVLGARVEKIDDNGFVTFSLSPSISAVRSEIPAGANCPPISILSIRSLDTGAVRVRDGQTLILTGVISDLDREVVTKWPILGDIPLVGQFFRASGKTREKRELVIMVTPRIINDNDGGTFGYGWQPGTPQSRQLMRNEGR